MIDGMVLAIICGFILLLSLGIGGFLLLVQLGVIVKKAGEPPHTDTRSYSLDQGREVGREAPDERSAAPRDERGSGSG